MGIRGINEEMSNQPDFLWKISKRGYSPETQHANVLVPVVAEIVEVALVPVIGLRIVVPMRMLKETIADLGDGEWQDRAGLKEWWEGVRFLRRFPHLLVEAVEDWLRRVPQPRLLVLLRRRTVVGMTAEKVLGPVDLEVPATARVEPGVGLLHGKPPVKRRVKLGGSPADPRSVTRPGITFYPAITLPFSWQD